MDIVMFAIKFGIGRPTELDEPPRRRKTPPSACARRVAGTYDFLNRKYEILDSCESPVKYAKIIFLIDNFSMKLVFSAALSAAHKYGKTDSCRFRKCVKIKWFPLEETLALA
jgi:hypothetical protein